MTCRHLQMWDLSYLLKGKFFSLLHVVHDGGDHYAEVRPLIRRRTRLVSLTPYSEVVVGRRAAMCLRGVWSGDGKPGSPGQDCSDPTAISCSHSTKAFSFLLDETASPTWAEDARGPWLRGKHLRKHLVTLTEQRGLIWRAAYKEQYRMDPLEITAIFTIRYSSSLLTATHMTVNPACHRDAEKGLPSILGSWCGEQCHSIYNFIM